MALSKLFAHSLDDFEEDRTLRLIYFSRHQQPNLLFNIVRSQLTIGGFDPFSPLPAQVKSTDCSISYSCVRSYCCSFPFLSLSWPWHDISKQRELIQSVRLMVHSDPGNDCLQGMLSTHLTRSGVRLVSRKYHRL